MKFIIIIIGTYKVKKIISILLEASYGFNRALGHAFIDEPTKATTPFEF